MSRTGQLLQDGPMDRGLTEQSDLTVDPNKVSCGIVQHRGGEQAGR